MPVQPQVFQPNPRRRIYAQIIQAALDAVSPERCIRQNLERAGSHIRSGGRIYNLDEIRHVYVVGGGKAAAAMARTVEDILGDRVDAGVVVVKDGYRVPTRIVEVYEAGHPIPDERSVEGARRVLDLVSRAGEDDLVIVLISGGGSALLAYPADSITLEDMRRTTDLLLRSGATINEINCVRKHCSQIKGGQLARHIAPARALGLILSDVIGNPLDVIASGPLTPDPTTFADAWAVIERYHLVDRIPPRVRAHLQEGMAGRVPETPKPGDPIFQHVHVVIVGDNARAAEAAEREAQSLGYNTHILSTFVEGEAREVARVIAALGKELVRYNRPLPTPACLVLGGETTVTVRGQGKGGRNQELALAAALALEGWERITVVALGTDGTDGPTDAAGGMVDGHTVERARAAGLDPERYLQENDAYPLLQATQDLLVTGPTLTNVNDLIFVFAEEGQPGE